MTEDPRRVAFIKTLVAAAWADGELSIGEIRTITEYLRRFEITAREYEELKPLLEQPMDLDQAHDLLRTQLEHIRSPDEQGVLISAVRDMLLTNGELTADESAFLRQVEELTRATPSPQVFVSRMRTLWSRQPPAGERRARQPDLAGRFEHRRLLEYFRHRMALVRAQAGRPLDSDIDDQDLLRVVIWAGLLSAVAGADNDFCPAEAEQLKRLLAAPGEMGDADLDVVIEAYREGTVTQFDLAHLVREFSRISYPDEAGRLLDCLFLVAAADGELQESELRVIQQIAARLSFSRDHYLAALDRTQRRMAEGWN